MNQQVKRILGRVGAAFGALGLGTALTVVSLLSPNIPQAAAFTASGGQVQSRSIIMGTAKPGAAATYLVSFKPTVTTALKGVIVDFCSGSPIIGDTTCGAPTGFTVGTPTVTYSNTTIAGGDPIDSTGLAAATGSWTAAALNTGRTLKLTNATGDTGALTVGTLYSFAITTVTNPTTTGTFYARILTYDSNTGDIASYAPGTEGSTNLVDYGGFALSTTTSINVTAKVQETLTFCTSGPISTTFYNKSPMEGDTADGGGSNCTAATTPNLTIGHGSPVQVIDNSQIDAAYAFTQLSTNATSGAVIRMHAGNACANAGLSTDGGTTCNISGLDNTAAAVLSTTDPNTGAAHFGLFVSASRLTTGVTSSTGTIAPDANYNDGTHITEGLAPAQNDMWFGMDNTASSGVTGTYGDVIASSSGPVNTVNNDLVFGAIASLTTPAGIYQGSESLIATGTF